MDNRGENQNSRATTTFSMINWPTPVFVQATKRARGKALCDMILALVEWAKAFTANHPYRGTVITDTMRAVPKR